MFVVFLMKLLVFTLVNLSCISGQHGNMSNS